MTNIDGPVLGYIILHYGKPYLKWALESIKDQVDMIAVFYTDKPSQGRSTTAKCPDTRQELLDIAFSTIKRQLIWIEGDWKTEGEHTDAVYKFGTQYKWAWRFDYDEIVPSGMVNAMIKQAIAKNGGLFQVPFIHFWKDFSHTIIDSQYPYRLIRFNTCNHSSVILDDQNGKWRVMHFGYAIPDEYMEYKWQVQGHSSELKPDWMEKVWKGNATKDLHPVSYGLWPEAKPFKKGLLPTFMRNHPLYKKG